VHTASQWEVYDDQFQTSLVFDSGEDAVNLEAIQVTPDLADGTQFWWRVRYKGDATGFSGWSAQSDFTTIDVFVQTPLNVTPINGEANQPVSPVLTSSQFVSVGGAQTHTASQWQISISNSADNVPDFSVGNLWDSGEDAVNLTQITAVDNDLGPNLDFLWFRVRHKGSLTDWSEWSTPTWFDMIESQVVTPAIVSPADAATDIALFPLTVTASAFSSTNGYVQTHTGTQWQISLNSSFTSIILDTGMQPTNLTSTPIPNDVLDYETTYYVRVKYQGSDTGDSDWSSSLHDFTTLDDPQNRVDAGDPYAWLATQSGTNMGVDAITISMWFKYSETVPQKWLWTQQAGPGDGASLLFQYSNQKFSFTVINTAGQIAKSISTAVIPLVSGQYYNVLFSATASSISSEWLYLNDISYDMTGTDTTLVWNMANMTERAVMTNVANQSTSGATKFREVADVWVDDVFTFFFTESNRRKFIDQYGKAVDLGFNGQTPFGSSPAQFFGDSMVAADWNNGTNRGSSVDFNYGVNWDNWTDA
jgi:hypothetical protein